MTLALIATLLAQSPINIRDEGLLVGTAASGINCSGSGITCTMEGTRAKITVSASGSGAPVGAKYLVQQADVDLTNEQAMGALGTGIVINTTTTGVQSIYTGATCTNQFVRSLNASGAATCSAVDVNNDTAGTLAVNRGGTGAAPGGDDQLLVSDSASAATWRTLTTCTGAGKALTYDVATNTFGCNTISGSNVVEKSIALSGGSGYFAATVTGETWVTTSSKITCGVLGTTADGLTPEAIAVAGLVVTVSDRVNATGFNVNVFSPYGLEGTVRVHCTGA